MKFMLSILLFPLHELPFFSKILMPADFFELAPPAAALEVGRIPLHFLFDYPLDYVWIYHLVI